MKYFLFVLFLLAFNYEAKAKDVYLFDVMQQPAYRQAWKEMVKSEQLPLWLKEVTKEKGNYVAAPVIDIPIHDVLYECFRICKPHNCSNENMKALFAPNGKQAWAIFIEEGKNPRWLGQPDDMVKKAFENCSSE